MPNVRCLLLLIPGLAGLPAVARAQTPAERVVLDSMRGSIAAIADSSTLVARERQRIAVARTDRDNAMLHMELGFISYRLGELTSVKKRYEDAASEFQWAADLRPRWAWAWYHLGLAELLTGESDIIIVENIRAMLGVDALSKAARAFARAVSEDPSFSEGLVSLATAAMRQRVGSRLLVAQSALRQAAATEAGRVPSVNLVRGRVERRLNDYDSALVAFRRYLATGGDSTIGGVEVARTLGLLSRPDSARVVYFAAVSRRIDDSAKAEVRRDLRFFAQPEELARYDALPADSLGAWLRTFWTGRDATDGRRAGERLTEQFRRYQYALANFTLVSKRRGFGTQFAHRDTTQQDFDDRGVIYLRHGEPARRSRYVGPGFEPNESWLYRRPPEPDLLLHFAALNDVQDYRLMQSLLAVCTRTGTMDGLMPSQAQQVGTWRDCVQSRAELSPDYERLAVAGASVRHLWATERQETMRMVAEATGSDSYVLTFESQLRPVVSVFTVADGGMDPELHVVFAVPAERLHPMPSGTAFAYPLAMRMQLFDSASHRVASEIDTVRVFRSSSPLGRGSFLTEQMVLRVPPGRYRYSFVIEEMSASSGEAVSNRAIEIPDLKAPFTASDIVLGRENSGLVWRRPEGDVALNPLMRFLRDGEATIYYELYGLPQGAQVETRVRILRAGGRSIVRRLFGGGGGADLSYTTTTDAPGRSTVRQTLNLRGLDPGRYRLQVELAQPGSTTVVTRESPFEIESRRAP